MAEIEAKDSGNGKKGRQKKMSTRVDFTPMVDMNMLLITFFMFCTTLSKPQVIEFFLPSDDEVQDVKKQESSTARTLTLLLSEDERVFYYLGDPKNPDGEFKGPFETKFGAKGGLRDLLASRNKDILAEVNALKKEMKEGKIDMEQFKEKKGDINEANPLKQQTVRIMIEDNAPYSALIGALDEVLITAISTYAVVDLDEENKKILAAAKAGEKYVYEATSN